MVLFLHAIALNGIALDKTRRISVSEDKKVLVTFDICSHSAPANTIQCLEINLITSVLPAMFLSFTRVFTPRADETFASFDPAETEHPPEAAL